MIIETSIVVGQPTANNHLFTYDVLEHAIKEFNEAPAKPFGMTYRSGAITDSSVQLDQVSHSINHAYINDEGRLCFDITITETPKGDYLSMVIEQCVPNTVSIGTVHPEHEVTDLKLCRLDMLDESDIGNHDEHNEGDIS